MEKKDHQLYRRPYMMGKAKEEEEVVSYSKVRYISRMCLTQTFGDCSNPRVQADWPDDEH